MSSSHWESSGHPLFVKTVYVNGNRHAILSKEDPLLQCQMRHLKKSSRSQSSLSFSSSYSTSTHESRDYSSEINYKISRSQQSYTNDTFSDLQTCLIKMKFSNIQDLKDSSRDLNNDFNRSKEDENQKLRTRRKRKKKQFNGINQRVGEERRFSKEDASKIRLDHEENKINLFTKNSNKGQEKKKDSSSGSEDGNLTQFISNCCCRRNFCSVVYPTEKNDIDNARKDVNILGETFYSLVMKTQTKDRASMSNYYEPANIGNSESYWNNYLAGSYNTSLTERVVQWIDLTKKQMKEEQSPVHNNTSPKKSVLQKTYDKNINKIESRKAQEKLEVDQRDKIIHDTSDHEVQLDISNDDTKAFSIIQRIEIDETNFDSKENLKERNLTKGYDEDNEKEKFIGHSTRNLIAEKADISETRLLSLQDCIISRFEAPVSNDLKSTHFDTHGEICNLREICPRDKKQSKCYGNTFYHKLNNFEEQQTKEEDERFKSKKTSDFNKKMVGAEISHKFHVLDENQIAKLPRNATEFKKLENRDVCMNRFTNENCLSINNVNFSEHPSNQYYYAKSDISSCKESKRLWKPEGNLEKPQLHIFIPSLSEKEANECEGFSPECSSFRNDF